MMGVTTVLYAAKRVAEAYNLDGQMFFGLARGGELLPMEDLILEHADHLLELVVATVAG